jgi:hypothetical protein
MRKLTLKKAAQPDSVVYQLIRQGQVVRIFFCKIGQAGDIADEANHPTTGITSLHLIQICLF